MSNVPFPAIYAERLRHDFRTSRLGTTCIELPVCLDSDPTLKATAYIRKAYGATAYDALGETPELVMGIHLPMADYNGFAQVREAEFQFSLIFDSVGFANTYCGLDKRAAAGLRVQHAAERAYRMVRTLPDTAEFRAEIKKAAESGLYPVFERMNLNTAEVWYQWARERAWANVTKSERIGPTLAYPSEGLPVES